MYKTIKILTTGFVLLLIPAALSAQGFSVSTLTHLINIPTAGSLERGSFNIEMRMYPGGGVLASVGVGLTDRINFGAGFGGMNIIGRGDVIWNPKPEVDVRYRIIEESYSLPALTIGYNSQGYGAWDESRERYGVKSPGAFMAASKNYEFLGNLGFHAGGSFSRENGDGDNDPNLFIGLDKSVNAEISLLAEYDFALNDNSDNSLGSKKGYLNAAVRWTFVERLVIEFDVTNILGNRHDTDSASRELKIIYLEYF